VVACRAHRAACRLATSTGGLAAIMVGQPSFFAPRPQREWFSPIMPTSSYSTVALKETLEQLVDFDRINMASASAWEL
jgi:NTE family protein